MDYCDRPATDLDDATFCTTHGWMQEPCECDVRDAAGLDPKDDDDE
jgi:hypothetical protein